MSLLCPPVNTGLHEVTQHSNAPKRSRAALQFLFLLKIVKFRFPIIRNDSGLSYFSEASRHSAVAVLFCVQVEANTEALKPWSQKYWSSSAPIKEQLTQIFWCLTSARATQRMRSSITRRNLLCVVLTGSRRWWPGPAWSCAEQWSVLEAAVGYTCAKSTWWPAPAPSFRPGKYDCSKYEALGESYGCRPDRPVTCSEISQLF